MQDGDSLVSPSGQGRNNDEFRVRLYAIDAPEHDQEYGRERGIISGGWSGIAQT